MKLKVKAFGITRDFLGGSDVELDLPGKTVADLRETLSARHPEIRSLRSLLIAVNQKYAEDGHELSESDEIALIPPVSGG